MMKVTIDMEKMKVIYPELVAKAEKLSEYYKSQHCRDISAEEVLVMCCEFGLTSHLRNVLDMFCDKYFLSEKGEEDEQL